MRSSDLFGVSGTSVPVLAAIRGLAYAPDFLDAAEEAELLQHIRALPLAPARYLQYTARRRIVCFGGQYDFSSRELLPAAPVPAFLLGLRERVAAFAGVPAAGLSHALVAEYAPGTPLGWHRDVPEFDLVTGVSLGSAGRMRFRRYPPARPAPRRTLRLELEPRSVYCLRDEARWDWQHAISPTRATRYSITFRSLRSASFRIESASPP